MIRRYVKPTLEIPFIEARIAEHNKKAQKMGFPGYQLRVVKNHKYVDYRDDSIKYVSEIEIEGEPARIAGWYISAKIDHGEDIVFNLSDGESDYSTFRQTPECVHCGTNRNRNITYILENDSGEKKQVGSSCLKDFLGHSPKLVTRQIDDEWALLQDLESACFADRQSENFLVIEVLKVAIAWLQTRPYISKTEAYNNPGKYSTAEIIKKNFFEPGSKEKIEITQSHKEKATAILRHFSEHPEKEKNDYIGNCASIADKTVANWKLAGYLISMVPGYDREIAKKRAIEEDKKSTFFGKVGERLKFDLTLTRRITLESSYGYPVLYFFKDTAGNIFTWKTEAFLCHSKEGGQIEDGDSIVLKGRIKEHKEYRGIKQTILTRCSQVFN